MFGINRQKALSVAVVVLLAAATPAAADESESRVSYGKNGWQYDDGSGNNYAWFGVRVQTRTGSSRVTQDELPGDPISQSSDTDNPVETIGIATR